MASLTFEEQLFFRNKRFFFKSLEGYRSQTIYSLDFNWLSHNFSLLFPWPSVPIQISSSLQQQQQQIHFQEIKPFQVRAHEGRRPSSFESRPQRCRLRGGPPHHKRPVDSRGFRNNLFHTTLILFWRLCFFFMRGDSLWSVADLPFLGWGGLWVVWEWHMDIFRNYIKQMSPCFDWQCCHIFLLCCSVARFII